MLRVYIQGESTSKASTPEAGTGTSHTVTRDGQFRCAFVAAVPREADTPRVLPYAHRRPCVVVVDVHMHATRILIRGCLLCICYAGSYQLSCILRH